MFQIRLKELREEKRISQAALAKILGISQSAVGAWESGVNKPEYSLLEKLAEYFDVSVDYLMCKSDNRQPQIDDDINAILQELKDRPEMKVLFSASSKATKEDIIRAAKFLDAMTDGSGQE